MPNGTERQWPSDEDIIAGCHEHGNVTEYARALDVSRATLASHIHRRGLNERVKRPKQALKAKAKPQDLGSVVSREEILEQENQELRKALRGERRHEVRNERVLVAIERALETVDPPAPLAVNLPAPLRTGDPAHHYAVFLLSDAHGGERVKPSAVNGTNAYDWDIMAERHAELLRALASHLRRMPPIAGLDLLILGDNCSGANHDELKVTNEYPLAVQGIKMGYLLGDFVRKATEIAGVPVRVRSVPGNHPRLERLPAAKDVDNNMDVVATVLAEETTRDLKQVDWQQPEGAAIFHEVAGRLLYIWHGDGIRSSMPGVPWGGVMRRVNAIQAQHHRHIDHFICGHYHQANVVQAGRIVMNGSVKGADEWVLKNFGQADPPTQLLLVFDAARERMTTGAHYLTPTAGIPEVGA